MRHGQAPAADRDADLPRVARAGLLLRGQDGLHRATARRGQALLPVAPAAVRQESVPGHAEGVVRGQRGVVRGALHPPAPQLVGAPSGGAAELRRRQLQGARESGRERDGATRGRGRTGGRKRALRHRAGTVRPSDPHVACPCRAAGGGAGGRVRQADPGPAGGEAGGGARQPRLPARIVRSDQGLRRARGVHVPDRHQQVLEGEPVLATEQPHRPDAGSGLFVDLRLHGGRPGDGVRAGAGRAGPGAGAGVVQRL